MNKISKVDGTLYRSDLEINSIDKENRRLRVSFSSENPYKRVSFFEEPWIEILGHKKGEIDLERLNNAAPILYNHIRNDSASRLGVVEKAWVENNRGYAEIRISKREEVNQYWQDIEDGILRNISVGYKINGRSLLKESKNKNEPNEYRVIKWTPMEISFVDVPADHTVGVGRSENYKIIDLQNEDFLMNEDELSRTDTGGAVVEQAVIDTPKAELSAQRSLAEPAEGAETGKDDTGQVFERNFREAETKRRTAIKAVLAPFAKAHPDVVERCLDDMTVTPEQASQIMLRSLGASYTPTAQIVRDEGETKREAMTEYLLYRAMPQKNPMTDKARIFNGYSLAEIARSFVQGSNGLSKSDLYSRAMSTSDFQQIFANIGNKVLKDTWMDQPQTFQGLVTINSVPDFKSVTRVGLSNVPDLKLIHEGDEYEQAVLSEEGESYSIATYGRMMRFTRKMFINDDLGAFTNAASFLSRAASRLESDIVWGQITSNPLMSDGNPLFHASHNNLVSTGTAISVASVSDMMLKLAMQTSFDGTLMGLDGLYLLCPRALKPTFDIFVNTNFVATKQSDINPYAGRLQVKSDVRLDKASTTAWYLTADPAQIDLIELSYLDGNQGVYTDSRTHWDTDDFQVKARMDAGAKILNWRGIVKNNGA